MKNTNRIGILLFLHSRNEISMDEEKELAEWRKISSANEKLYQNWGDPEYIRKVMTDFYKERDRTFERVKVNVPSLAKIKLSSSPDYVPDPETEALQEEYRMGFPENAIAESGLSKAAFWESMLSDLEFMDEKGFRSWRDTKVVKIDSKKKKKKSWKRKLAYWTIGIAASFVIGIIALIANMYFTPEPAPGRFAIVFGATGLNREKKDDYDRGRMDGIAHVEKTKTAKGEPLSIFPDHPKRPKDYTYTLETKTGHQFILRLPDGTQVWMGTRSSIHFPANFSQDTIRVTISGEAYFEMPANAKHQLFVRSADSAGSILHGIQVQTKEALFMFRANPGEPVSVNMIQGSASVRQEPGIPDSVLNLQTGQQAILNQGKLSLTALGDTSELLALKNGEIYIKEASLHEILEIVGRWYYIAVNNDGLATDKKFTLRVPLGSDLSVIIDALNKQGAHLSLFRKTIAARKEGSDK